MKFQRKLIRNLFYHWELNWKISQIIQLSLKFHANIQYHNGIKNERIGHSTLIPKQLIFHLNPINSVDTGHF